MKTEGAFLYEIKRTRTNKESVKYIDIEIPDDTSQMLEKIDDIIEKLGKQNEQIYYTVGKIRRTGKTLNEREGISQKYLLIDLDYVLQDKKEEYIKLFCEHFGLEREKTGIVDSGYGIQFLIGFKKEAYKKDFADAGDAWRKQVRLFHLLLKEKGLVGVFDVWNEKEQAFIPTETHIDTSVYRLASMARLPGTVNNAPHKRRDARETKLIQGKVEPQAESLLALLQKNLVDGDEAEAPQIRTLAIDHEFVKANCGFLQHFLNNPKEVHENEFFLVSGILKRCFEDESEGEQACLDWFKRLQRESLSPTITGANEHWAMAKIIRAYPSAYKKIDSMGDWSKNDPGRPKIAHPLQMKSPTFVASRKTGFHSVKENKNGKITRVPEYDDLRKFFEGKYNYVSSNEECWVFNGKFFERFPHEYLKNFAQEHFDPIADTSMVNEFCNLVLRTNLVAMDDWDKARERKVNFQNGVLDIDSGLFVEHDDKLTTMKFRFKSILPYAYDKEANAPVFEKFLNDVTSGSKEFQNIILEFAGYALSGDKCWLPQTLLLNGPGGGGKSKLLDCIKNVAGENNYSSLSFEDLNNAQSRAELEDKFFNVFDETEGSKYIETKNWKSLTTGGEITIKRLYQQPYSIKNRAKMLFSCNTIPKSNDTSDGFFRRWIVVPFVRNFLAEGIDDPFIDEKLSQELPGIFNLFLAGYLRLKKRRKWELGADSEKAFAEFKETIDPTIEWFKDYIEDLGSVITNNAVKSDEEQAARNKFVSSSDLFHSFKDFCEESNLKIAMNMMTRRAFSAKLQKMLLHPHIDRRIKRRGSGGEPVWGFWGLRLRVEG